MEYSNKVFHLREYKLSYLQENVETIVYAMLCFLVPFLIGGPQILVGTLVNGALILGALNVRTYRLLPVILMPSIGAFAAGVIFNAEVLIFMIPFIWIGNFLLVYTFKYLFLGRKINRWITLGGGALLKASFLFLMALVLVSLNILPTPVLIGMGPVQLLTAISGGVLAFAIQYVKKRYTNIS